jgi:DNA-binding LytR/AlgR family response regulator
MFNVCVVDDVFEETSKIKDIVSSFNEEFIIETYLDSTNEKIIKKNYDLYLLDIDMDKLNGIDLGKKIRKNNEKSDIIFVSRREDLVFESFSVGILYFVRKSNLVKDLQKALAVIYDRYNLNSKKYHYENKNISKDINYIDIQFIEVYRNDLIIHTSSKKYVQRKTLSKIQEDIDEKCFEKISKSFIINFENIDELEERKITMNNSEVIYLSKRKIIDFKNKYFQYLEDRGR